MRIWIKIRRKEKASINHLHFPMSGMLTSIGKRKRKISELHAFSLACCQFMYLYISLSNSRTALTIIRGHNEGEKNKETTTRNS